MVGVLWEGCLVGIVDGRRVGLDEGGEERKKDGSAEGLTGFMLGVACRVGEAGPAVGLAFWSRGLMPSVAWLLALGVRDCWEAMV